MPLILFQRWAPKKKPPPLHVSLARIGMERVAVAQRTRIRIALLLTHAQDDNKGEEVPSTSRKKSPTLLLPNHLLFLCVVASHEPPTFTVAVL